MLNFIFIYNKGSVFDSVYTYSYHSVVSIHRKPVLLARFGRYYKLATAHCIFRKSVKLLFGANIRARWGVSYDTTGASPRNPQMSAAPTFSIANPRQMKFHLHGTHGDAMKLPGRQFITGSFLPCIPSRQGVPPMTYPHRPCSCPTPTLSSSKNQIWRRLPRGAGAFCSPGHPLFVFSGLMAMCDICGIYM